MYLIAEITQNNDEVIIMNDTVELLKECNAGVKMGVSSIDEVLDRVQNNALYTTLIHSKNAHSELGQKTRNMLDRLGASGKEPNPMAKSMSWVRTNVMMSMDNSDSQIANLITDGCNMGVKSLNKYLNEYEKADREAKEIAKDLIKLETDLANDISEFL